MADYHLQALELAKAGHWDEAHRLIQPYSDMYACLIHGYLHRLKGDNWNAAYWYNRAGCEMLGNTLEQEWEWLAGMVE